MSACKKVDDATRLVLEALVNRVADDADHSLEDLLLVEPRRSSGAVHRILATEYVAAIDALITATRGRPSLSFGEKSRPARSRRAESSNSPATRR